MTISATGVITSRGSAAVPGIAVEFGGTKPDQISEYYRGGVNVPASSAGTIAQAGTQKFSNYRGAEKAALPVWDDPMPTITLNVGDFLPSTYIDQLVTSATPVTIAVLGTLPGGITATPMSRNRLRVSGQWTDKSCGTQMEYLQFRATNADGHSDGVLAVEVTGAVDPIKWKNSRDPFGRTARLYRTGSTTQTVRVATDMDSKSTWIDASGKHIRIGTKVNFLKPNDIFAASTVSQDTYTGTDPVLLADFSDLVNVGCFPPATFTITKVPAAAFPAGITVNSDGQLWLDPTVVANGRIPNNFAVEVTAVDAAGNTLPPARLAFYRPSAWGGGFDPWAFQGTATTQPGGGLTTPTGDPVNPLTGAPPVPKPAIISVTGSFGSGYRGSISSSSATSLKIRFSGTFANPVMMGYFVDITGRNFPTGTVSGSAVLRDSAGTTHKGNVNRVTDTSIHIIFDWNVKASGAFSGVVEYTV